VSESSHDFGKDIVPSVIASGDAYAYRFNDLYEPTQQGYWRDVGTIDAYHQANIELTYVVPDLNLYDAQWPIWTLQEQVPPAKFVFDDSEMAGAAIESLVAGGCIISGARVQRSVLFVNARVERGSVVEDSLLLPGAVVGRNCQIRRAIIDEGCVIPDGTRIGHNAKSDKKNYHVSAGGITLVTREMLEG